MVQVNEVSRFWIYDTVSVRVNLRFLESTSLPWADPSLLSPPLLSTPTGLHQYADPVTDLLDQCGVFRTRLFRESCVFHQGCYVKDLSRLGRDLHKTLILDNSPASYIFHPNNAVSVIEKQKALVMNYKWFKINKYKYIKVEVKNELTL